MLQATRDIPIVFVHVPDPIGAGFVDSLARPGGKPRASRCLIMGSARNGWNCLNRSCRP
jgi:hypothetical protein